MHGDILPQPAIATVARTHEQRTKMTKRTPGLPDRPLPELATVNQEPAEPTYRRLAWLVGNVSRLLGRREWHGQEKVPQTGGVLVVANHTSYYDPLAIGEYLIWSGRWPRYLGKVAIFRTPGLGWLARACGQIPVDRFTEKAVDALLAAEAALDEGKCVAMYPEGTLTHDPDGWPMTAKSGAARLALETGVPVVPVACWGAHDFMPPHRKGFPFVFSRRHRFQVACGDPVSLDDLRVQPVTAEVLAEASTRIMDAITDLVAGLRGVPAPSERWDRKVAARTPVRRGQTGTEPVA